jgi:ectoine hydroxylase-related dioxygenase (phytanoyl-CoA dioxygenase family)
VFAGIGSAATVAAVDDVLGAGRWTRPKHWGQFLVSFPERGRRWVLPAAVWHSDAAYTEPLEPLSGVMVFSFLNRVERGGGGTLVLAGSHRLVARFAAGRPSAGRERGAASRKAFYRSHPWLADLVRAGDDPTRNDRFTEEADVDGLPARVVELTGEPGDVVITHPLMAHCVSPNCARQPRFMRVARPRACVGRGP